MQPRPVQEKARDLAQRYANEIRQQAAISGVDSLPQTRGVRQAYWALALLGALALGTIEAALLLEPEGRLAPAAPATVLAVERADPCAMRQRAIMDAISAYHHDHGEAPTDLTALGPQYLKVSPVDPASGRPYVYRRSGDAIFLSCPNPELHPIPRLAAHRAVN